MRLSGMPVGEKEYKECLKTIVPQWTSSFLQAVEAYETNRGGDMLGFPSRFRVHLGPRALFEDWIGDRDGRDQPFEG